MKSNQIVTALIVMVFLGFLTWSEVKGLDSLQKQIKTESFQTTEGKVIDEEVIVYHGSKTTKYTPNLTYTYEIGGVKYNSHRYRYGKYSFYNRNDAEQVLHNHPIGSNVRVYYDPLHPNDALLSPGVTNQDVFSLLILLVPIPVLLQMIWNIFAQIQRSGSTVAPAGWQVIIQDGLRIRVRLPQYKPSYLASMTFAIVTVPVSFWVAKTSVDPIFAGKIALICMCAIPGGVFIWARMRVASGKQDLVIDEVSKTLALPQTFKRKTQVTLPFSEVSKVQLVKVAHQRRYGVNYTYAPTLRLRDGSRQRLTDLDQERASAFCAWLSGRIGLTDSTIQEEIDENPGFQ